MKKLKPEIYLKIQQNTALKRKLAELLGTTLKSIYFFAYRKGDVLENYYVVKLLSNELNIKEDELFN